MPDSSPVLNSEIVVIGAGVLGLCTAVELTRRGHQVMVVDPGEDNASSVAAGMIAPALEAVLDEVSPERAALFRDARAAWEGFAGTFGIAINPARTIWAGGDHATLAENLTRLGFEYAEADSDGRLAIPSDILIEPGPALAAMRMALAHPVVSGRCDAVTRTDGDWRVVTGKGDIACRTLVLATGAAEPVEGLPTVIAEQIRTIAPIRGQIGSAKSAQTEAVVRGHGVYVAPSGQGVVLGATMEPGRRDLKPDAAAGEVLKVAAERMVGQHFDGPIEWRVGIRGATRDGLPMAGASGEPGLFLALAPRRNGWLLGPLVGRIVADQIDGLQGDGVGSPHAAALDPLRFANR